MKSNDGASRKASFLTFAASYWLVLVFVGLVGIVLAAGGHGVLWPMGIWLVLLLPTSALTLGVWVIAGGANRSEDLFGIIVLVAGPLVNACVLWPLWRWLRRVRRNS